VTHHGDVGPLWSLIGERARSVTWAGEIEIVFTNGAQLVIPAAINKAPRGTLYGIRREPDDPYMVEDF